MMNNTGFLDKVESVSGVMKSLEAGVITTLTLAPAFINNRTKLADLYAAIPAVMPSKIFLSFKIDILQV